MTSEASIGYTLLLVDIMLFVITLFSTVVNVLLDKFNIISEKVFTLVCTGIVFAALSIPPIAIIAFTLILANS